MKETTAEDLKRLTMAELPVIRRSTGKPFLYLGDALNVGDPAGSKAISIFRDPETGRLFHVPADEDVMRFFESER